MDLERINYDALNQVNTNEFQEYNNSATNDRGNISADISNEFKNLELKPDFNDLITADNKSNNAITISDGFEKYREILSKHIIEILKDSKLLWKDLQTQTKSLRGWYGFGMLGILSIQVLALAAMGIILISTHQENYWRIGGFSTYSIGLLAQMLYIPKVIAEHLFPKEQANQINETLKLAMSYNSK